MDAIVGLRLGGIEGVFCHDEKSAREAITDAVAKPDIAVVLITEQLADMCRDLLVNLKKNIKEPLIVEFPEFDTPPTEEDSIARYVRETIGVKI